MIVLSDTAFHATRATCNLKLCQRGEWHDRMLVETVLSMLTLVSHFKKVMHRVWAYFQARLAFTMAAFNVLVRESREMLGVMPPRASPYAQREGPSGFQGRWQPLYPSGSFKPSQSSWTVPALPVSVLRHSFPTTRVSAHGPQGFRRGH